MATFTTRTMTVTRHEWVVPAEDPYGACWVEVFKAFHAAENDHRRLRGMAFNPAPGVRLCDLSGDAIRMLVRDAEIVIYFTTEATAPWRCIDDTCDEPRPHMTLAAICRWSK